MRHDWKYFPDATAKCRRCGMNVVSSATFIEDRRDNCRPVEDKPMLGPMMTEEESEKLPSGINNFRRSLK